MIRPIRLLIPALLLFFARLQAQVSPELTGILERLDRLEQQNRELMEEIRALRTELASARNQTVAVSAQSEQQAAPSAQLEQQVEVQGQRQEEQAQAKVEASQRFPIRLTGMALFNAFENSHQSGGVDYPTVASEPGPGHAGATVHQTILGLDFRGPETLWGGRVHGSVYMDFFSGSAPLTQTMRLRTASIEVDWATRSVLVGFEKPIFNPREPSSLAQVGVSPLTSAGNLWLWMPQARVEQDFSFGSQSGLRAVLGVVQTHEVGAYPGSPPVATLEASRPGLEGRYEFFHKFDEDRRLEIAPGFHISTTHAGGFSIPSQVFSTDWFFNPVRRLEFSGAYYRGQNVAMLGTGAIRQGFYLMYNSAEAVQSQGGWGQLTIHTLRRLDFHLFSGQQDDRAADLITGGIRKNLLFGGNLYYRLAPNVLLGWETTQVRTVYLGQGTRINNHYDLALAYLF
jgi:hypothetical protein